MRYLLIIATLFTLLLSSTLKEGEVLGSVNLQDAHEKPYSIEGVKYIIFSGDKASGKMGHEVLNQKSQKFLEDKRVVYITDLSGVPSLIYSFFMEDKYKEANYKIGIIWEEEDAVIFPKKEDNLTLITLDSDKISNIRYISSKEQLEEFLDSI